MVEHLVNQFLFQNLIDSNDGEGWLVATEFNAKENRSNLVILDAMNVSDGPIAVAQLPHRVPYGFHGWFENRA